jgi:hypothetical protein
MFPGFSNVPYSGDEHFKNTAASRFALSESIYGGHFNENTDCDVLI